MASTTLPEDIQNIQQQITGRPCLVVGSAPLQRALDINPDDYVIVANGSISSVPDVQPNLWFLNSRMRPKPTWDKTRLFLHKHMMEQCRNRSVDTVAFVLRQPKSDMETKQWLSELNCTFRNGVVVTSAVRRIIDKRLCIGPGIVPPASAGMLGVLFAVQSGASSVRMRGFSWEAGYAYLPPDKVPSTARGHVKADQIILEHYCKMHPGIIDTGGLI